MKRDSTGAEIPGRTCPTAYRIAPEEFLSRTPIDCGVLYVVGGLYGNPEALRQVRALFDAERVRDRRLVFNGDFHWFDADRDTFDEIERSTRAEDFERLRGNVETELAADGVEAGCGCAYPDDVGQGTVDRSNRIAARLREVAAAAGAGRDLAELPRVSRYRVGRQGVAVTHGDDRSMAGWSLASDRIDASIATGLARRLDAIGASVLACSHTCLACARTFGDADAPKAVFNNGSAGMANFDGSADGLITRVARRDAGEPPIAALYGIEIGDVRIDAVPVRFDLSAWWRRFARIWPPGSDAAVSYGERIRRGPAHRIDDALGRARVTN